MKIKFVISKVVTFALVFLFTFNVFSVDSEAAADPKQVEKIIEEARSFEGSAEFDGYCQRFVRVCFESAGIYQDESVSCAAEACRKWMVSTSRNNIPIGAVMYFKTSKYGHSAIYIGNNRMIHAKKTVCEQEITEGFWKLYLGWGWQAGKEPIGLEVFDKQAFVNDADRDSKITIQ